MESGSTPVRWHALYTKPRHEKQVDRLLCEKHIETYLPLRRVLHRWSDRKKWVEEPLFRSYLFIHADPRDRQRALFTPGALRFVAFGDGPAVVRDEEIETVRRILAERTDVESCPPVTVGDIVEIARGPLMGIRGRLDEIRHGNRLVITVDSIRQALRFTVDLADVRVVHEP